MKNFSRISMDEVLIFNYISKTALKISEYKHFFWSSPAYGTEIGVWEKKDDYQNCSFFKYGIL